MIDGVKRNVLKPFSLLRQKAAAVSMPLLVSLRGHAKALRDKTKTLCDKARAADYFALAESGVERLKHPFYRFQQVLTEANYNARPRSIISLLRGEKRRPLPETASTLVGQGIFSTTKTVGNRFLWTAVFAALSTHTLIATAAVMTATGAALFGLEYYRALRDRADMITEINVAGQKVRGRRKDLCRLHLAQQKILNLGDTFKQASLESTSDTIANIMKSVEQERKRVEILDTGYYGAFNDTYDFSRPRLTLVNEDERLAATSAQPAFAADASLKESWRQKRDREGQIIRELVALQKSLPPHLKKRLKDELRKSA